MYFGASGVRHNRSLDEDPHRPHATRDGDQRSGAVG
jgi:hypothetical protein